MLPKYLVAGLTFFFIYYLWPSSVPYEMDRTKPSIGISLTASYGNSATCLGLKWNNIHESVYRRTISLRHSDGSFEDLGRIEGDSSYIKTMRRLSSRAASHPRYIFQSELFF